jgi:hypothetical protein
MINIKDNITLQKQIELENLADNNCLIRVVAGSHAYGTNIEGSDWDERSIFADDFERIILPFDKIEQVKYREDDKVSFELSKYMPLLLSQNPNVIELLWTEDKDVLFKNNLGQLLIDNRKEFLSIQVKDSYVGYALAQLKRIKGHNKWINNPQSEKEPEQKDFLSVVWNFSNKPIYNKQVPLDGYVAIHIGNNTFSLWNADILNLPTNKSWIDKRGNPKPIDKEEFNKININNISPDLIVKVNTELFESHHTNWKMYWNWKTQRNEKRGELEKKFGYDVKHAMHLIRLLRSGINILETGIVPVKREDAQYLLDIRFGKFTYEEIVSESERLSKQIEDLSSKTLLPKEPNFQLAKEVMLEIYSKQWNMSINNITKIKPSLIR